MADQSRQTEQLNVRVPIGAAEDLRLIAKIEGTYPRDLILEGIETVVASRREDPHFRSRLEDWQQRETATANRLLG